MNALLLAGLGATVFFTSLLSGVFGMAGGMTLMWVLLFVVPVATAIAVNGAVQMVANLSRVWFTRDYVDWRILVHLTLGMLCAAILLFLVSYRPNLIVVSLAIGLMPALVWLPVRQLHLDSTKPLHALLTGFVSGGLGIGVGVSGPVIDVSFVHSMLDRRKVIATKAAAQVLTQAAKVLFYWSALTSLGPHGWVALLAAVPIAVLGTFSGNVILRRMTDAGFRRWTRWIVTAIGAVYLSRGLLQFT